MIRERTHTYALATAWIGPDACATTTYAGYSRDHTLRAAGKETTLDASADPVFRGDGTRLNPEELLVAALSSCHLLSYLAWCAREAIDVRSYCDQATGTMQETAGAGRFVSVVLRPHVVVAGEAEVERARALHERAHADCFIANSVNFPVHLEPVVRAVG